MGISENNYKLLVQTEGAAMSYFLIHKADIVYVALRVAPDGSRKCLTLPTGTVVICGTGKVWCFQGRYCYQSDAILVQRKAPCCRVLTATR